MRIQKESVVTLLLMLAVILSAGSFVYYFGGDGGSVEKGTPLQIALSPLDEANAFTDLSGAPVSLEESINGMTVVYTWASWCPSCATDLPVFATLATDFSSEEMTFIAMNRSENKTVAQLYLDTLPTLEQIKIVLDPSDHLFKSVAGYTIPEVIIFDTEGTIVYHSRGVFDPEAVKEQLRTNQ